MLKIRLARTGANKRPFFPIVVTNGRNPRDGSHLEKLGFFNPIAAGGEERLRIDLDKIQAWVSKGAQLSPRVASLVKEAKQDPAVTKAKKEAKAAKLKAKAAAKKAAAPAADAAPAEAA